MKKVSFYTLGCKVNQYETNAMAQKFKEAGYEIVEVNDDVSDICVINTCTVTNMSDRKSRQILRKVKEKNQDAIIAAVGCYAIRAKLVTTILNFNNRSCFFCIDNLPHIFKFFFGSYIFNLYYFIISI